MPCNKQLAACCFEVLFAVKFSIDIENGILPSNKCENSARGVQTTGRGPNEQWGEPARKVLGHSQASGSWHLNNKQQQKVTGDR